MADRPAITLIAGPTASGKSRLALETARRTGGLIINADSQQLYADLRILSARPSLEDEMLAEHRLYGVADAADPWSVGRWARAVIPVLSELAAERRHAILVGGTGLYFDALTRGLADIPPVPEMVREAVAGQLAAQGEPGFRRALAAVDPRAEGQIAPGDHQRLVRALAVYEATGRSLSDWRDDTVPMLDPASYEPIVMAPDRAKLYAACDRRVLDMVDAGALDEVATLRARGLDSRLPAMKAVGVPEFSAVLAGTASLPEAIAATQQATRRYAKRQLTWIRNRMTVWFKIATKS